MSLTIVMYHYVRRPERKPFPHVNVLHTDAFILQLQHIVRHYNPITPDDLLRAVSGGAPLPERAILLTFDDGYRDCIRNVAPLLHEHGIRACFFPVSDCLQRSTVLQMNKIQFLRAAMPIPTLLAALRPVTEASGMVWEDLWHKYAIPSRWDPAEVRFIKNVLQYVLPESLRENLVNDLFRRHVCADEAYFSHELYCQEDELRQLLDMGHSLGSHGHTHRWLNHLTPAEQEEEISQSLSFLRKLGVDGDWMMCYPHGGEEPRLIDSLRAKGFRVGFTTRVGLADVGVDDPLLLPRINTNDLPPIRSSAEEVPPPSGNL